MIGNAFPCFSGSRNLGIETRRLFSTIPGSPPAMNITFSDRQSRIITQALTGLALLTLTALVFFMFLAVIRFLSAFSSVLLPLATAGILSLLLRPAVSWLRAKTKLPTAPAAILVLLGFFIPILLLIISFGGLLIVQINNLIQALPELWERLQAWAAENAPALENVIERAGGQEEIDAWVKDQSAPLLNLAAGGAQGLLGILSAFMGFLSWLVLPVYLIFFLIAPPFSFENLRELLSFVKEEQREDIMFLTRQFVDIVVVFFRGQLLIALIQGLIMAVGFSLTGLSYGFILGLLFGLLNLIPYLGNIVGLAIVMPLAWFQPGGGPGLLISVLVVLGVTQTIESYYLTPKIMGKQTGLHPMAVIFAMFFWGKAFSGILGLILAIPLTAFLVVFWRLAREKYLPHPSE